MATNGDGSNTTTATSVTSVSETSVVSEQAHIEFIFDLTTWEPWDTLKTRKNLSANAKLSLDLFTPEELVHANRIENLEQSMYEMLDLWDSEVRRSQHNQILDWDNKDITAIRFVEYQMSETADDQDLNFTRLISSLRTFKESIPPDDMSTEQESRFREIREQMVDAVILQIQSVNELIKPIGPAYHLSLEVTVVREHEGMLVSEMTDQLRIEEEAFLALHGRDLATDI